ncbi:MAG: ABC transporter substrate-binding protein [Kofleriaceae bacterium]
MVRLGILVALAAATAACFERGGAREAPAPAAAALPSTATGWRTADPPGVPDPTATVRLALEAEPATLDPFATLDAASGRVLAGVVEGLWCPTGDGGVEPCVAASYQRLGQRYIFHLDPARRFSDGAAVTAADVVASLDASRGVGHAPGPLAGVLDDAVAITAVDPATVALEVRGDRATRLRDLALVPIVPARQLASPSLASAPIGTGPLAIASWTRGEAIRLRRVDGAARRAGAAAVAWVVVADRADAIRRLAAGQLDVVTQVPIAEAVAATAAHPRLARFRYAQPAMLVAVYNCRRPALADPAVRRDLTATLDRAGIARTILGGAATVTGPWLPDDPRADPTVAPIPFARARAAHPPALAVLVPAGSTTTARIADIWAQDARGRFALTVETAPFADVLARLAAGDFDVAITSISAGPEVDPGARLTSAAPPDQAWPGLRDAALDRALAALAAAPDAGAQIAAGREVHRLVAALAPMAFIAVDTRAGLAAATVGGLGAAPGAPEAWRLWQAR